MRVCYQCGHESPDQAFCGFCGSALDLKDYISASIRHQLESRDRSIVEADSANRVFERVFGWAKNFAWFLGVLFGIIGLLGAWKISDFWSSVNAAKQSVAATSDAAKEQISKSTSASTAEVKQTVEHAKSTMATNLQQADKQSESLNSAMNQMRVETKSFESSMGDSRRQLNEAKKLQPEMTSMRKDLQDAVAQIRKQQEVISSSEEFVKQVFSSHQIDIFHVGTETKTRLTTIGPPAGGDGSVVLLVLSSTPIRETLQVQYRVFTQPPDSYVTIHNLLIFFWGEHLANLNGQELSASYFPDKSDTEHINALSEHDGRVFADKEPLPYFNKPDPTFKGNRWFKSAAEAPAQK